jgi:hypothetical protein
MLDLLEHLQDFHAKLPVKMSNVVLTPTANLKETKHFAFAKKVGLSFPLTFQRAALTSTSVMNLMDHQECAALMPNVLTLTVHSVVHVHQDSLEIPSSNALISTNVQDKMLVAKMQSAKTLKDHSLAFALKVQSLTQIQLCDVLLLFLATPTTIALEMQFATLINAASALNQTLAMIAVIHASI